MWEIIEKKHQAYTALLRLSEEMVEKLHESDNEVLSALSMERMKIISDITGIDEELTRHKGAPLSPAELRSIEKMKQLVIKIDQVNAMLIAGVSEKTNTVSSELGRLLKRGKAARAYARIGAL